MTRRSVAHHLLALHRESPEFREVADACSSLTGVALSLAGDEEDSVAEPGVSFSPLFWHRYLLGCLSDMDQEVIVIAGGTAAEADRLSQAGGAAAAAAVSLALGRQCRLEERRG